LSNSELLLRHHGVGLNGATPAIPVWSLSPAIVPHVRFQMNVPRGNRIHIETRAAPRKAISTRVSLMAFRQQWRNNDAELGGLEADSFRCPILFRFSNERSRRSYATRVNTLTARSMEWCRAARFCVKPLAGCGCLYCAHCPQFFAFRQILHRYRPCLPYTGNTVETRWWFLV
jgi:hypothetical protein